LVRATMPSLFGQEEPDVADLKTFGLNIYVLIGALILLAVLAVLIVAAWTLLKILIWRARQRQAEADQRRDKLRPDGQPYPPAAPGVCGRCQRAFDQVYHLPSGERLCPDCYAREIAPKGTSRE
jgi:hypothetical protein